MTKRTKIFLAVLVVVAVAAHAYLYWWNNTEDHGVLDTIPVVNTVSESLSNAVRPAAPAPGADTETDTPDAATPDSSVAYRGYENTEFKFSFTYPETWTVSQSGSDGKTTLCLNEKDGTGGCLVTITRAEESVNVSTDNALDAFRAEFRAGSIKESKTKVGDDTATLLRVSGYPAGEADSTRAVVFVHNRQVYTVEAAAGQEAVFDRLTNSFLFQS